MTKLQTLLVSAAAGMAALATVGAADAGTKVLTATETLQSYTVPKTEGITFDYTIVPGAPKDLAVEFYAGDTLLFTETPVGPLTTSGSYTLFGTVSKGLTLDYQLTAVPEPAAWAMMLVGFGGVGAAMRRRSVKTATAA